MLTVGYGPLDSKNFTTVKSKTGGIVAGIICGLLILLLVILFIKRDYVKSRMAKG